MSKPHKHAELIKAWADGAEIEYSSAINGTWEPIHGVIMFDQATQCEFRIKPEREYPKTSFASNELQNLFFSKTLMYCDIGNAKYLEEALNNVANAAIKRYIQDQEKDNG